MRNLEKFIELAEFLDEHEELYAQDTWGDGLTSVDFHGNIIECGSHACIAGHTAALAGVKPWKGTNSVTGLPIYDWTNTSDGRPVAEVAAEILEMDFEDADNLFDATWAPREMLTLKEALIAVGLGADPLDVRHGDTPRLLHFKNQVADFLRDRENQQNALTEPTESDKVTTMTTTFTPKEIKKALKAAGLYTDNIDNVFAKLGIETPETTIANVSGLGITAFLSVNIELDDIDLTGYVDPMTLEGGDINAIVEVFLGNYDLQDDISAAVDGGDIEVTDFDFSTSFASFTDEDGEEVA